MFERIGRAVRAWLHEVSYSLGFFYQVLKESALFFRRKQVGYRVLIMQILFTGYEALLVTAVLAMALGVAINFIAASLLSSFGQGKLGYNLLIVVITRELGPLLTAFIVIARSGTAIATEVGGMVVNHEIEAYVSVGVNPISYLAAPRCLGVVISMIVLNIYFNAFGLLGSLAVMQVIHPVGMDDYFRNLFSVLTATDLFLGLLKSLVFGIIISTVSLYRGFSVENASTEIPVAGIKAVGSCFLLCVLADAAITAIQYV